MPRARPAEIPPPPRRSGGALAASLLVHLVVIAGLVRVLTMPHAFDSFFRPGAPPPAVERLTFVERPSPTADGRPAGGRGAPAPEPAPGAAPSRPVAPAAAIQAPSKVPDGVSTPAIAPPAPQPAGSGGSGGGTAGRGSGDGGGMAGLRPSFTDPRVWLRAEPQPGPPRSAVQRIDSMIVADFGPLRDSAAAEAARRKPGDWTFEKDGKKYGIDSRFIHLGRFSLPTAVLGLLPLNQQANPTVLDENRRLGGVRQEIAEQALRRRNDTDFNDVVRSIRERKERERAERKAATAAAVETPPGSR